ncbi:MAG: hypothetical protein Q8K99_05620 [Actinomycetota bacterium]|nr:hypothetical protein [Actinomycetota bacterium]
MDIGSDFLWWRDPEARFEPADRDAALGITAFCGGEVWSPLREEPALFLKLAAVDENDEDALLAFAREYGMLGSRMDDPTGVEFGGGVEEFEVWRDAIRVVRAAVSLWRPDYSPGIEPVLALRWVRSHAIWDNPVECVESSGLPFSRPEDYVSFRVGDDDSDEGVKAAAHRATLTAMVNKHLALLTAVELRTYADCEHAHLVPGPRTLLGAIWLQLAGAIAGNLQYRACPQCGGWVEVPEGFEGVRYCSKKCSIRKYWSNVYEVAELVKQGKSDEQIAVLMGEGVTLKQVEGWRNTAIKRGRLR